MSAYDLANNIKVVFATTSAIDTAGFESVTVAASEAVTLTECDTSAGNFTAVADADLIKTAIENQVGYRGHKQFIKVTPAGAAVILGNPRHKAVA